MAIKQFLTLAELREQGPNDPIWVLNTTNEMPRIGQYADVILPIRNANGDPSRIVIGVTWLPVDLTAQVPRKDIIADANFLKAVRDGTITPVTQAWAENELASKEARVEQDRLHEQERSYQLAASTMTDEGPEKAEVRTDKTGAKPSKVSPEFISWAERGAQLADTNLVNAMKLRRKYSRLELLYLRKVIGDKPLSQEAIRAKLEIIESNRARRRAAKAAKA